MRYRSFPLQVLVAACLVGLVVGAQADPSASVLFERSGSYGWSATCQVALGDLDGDGDLDAVFSNMHSRSEIWLNNGSAHFIRSPQRIGDESHGAAIGDLDNDGDEDLILTYASTSEPTRVFWNDGTGRFTPAELGLGDDALNGNAIGLFDLEGDGDLDVGVYYATGVRHSRVYVNQGNGTFHPVAEEIPGLAAWGDLDGDGDCDPVSLLHSTNGGPGIQVFRNDGENHYERANRISVAVPFLPGAISLGDIDGDRDLDVVGGGGSTLTSPITVLLNEGDGVFEPVLGNDFGNAGRVALADFDGDGRADIYLASLGSHQRIGLSDGTGAFIDAQVPLGSHDMLGSGAAGDLDGDGDVDLFISVYGSGGPNEVWLNVMD